VAKPLMKTILAAILYLSFTQAFSAVKGANPDRMAEVKKMEREIKKQEKEIKAFAADINRLENLLSSKNQSYLEIQGQKELLLKSLDEIEKKRKTINEEVQKTKVQFQHLVKGMILVSLNQHESSAALLERKVILETIRKIKNDQQLSLDTLESEEKRLAEIHQNYQQQVEMEKELLAVLAELEEQKANNETLVLEYQKKRTQAILDKGKMEETKGAIKVSFHTPIEEFSQIEHDQKGVTFHYKGKKEIRAPREGKIVYSGELASYGNVIMIDHGQDERSVILGEFNSRVKKGDDVTSLQTIAYAKENLNGSKIYFEVRKENQVQNTIHLLDRNSLTKEANTLTQL
jgi:septal ring factor EnvC (AmiA/AmiB activator)